MNWIKSTSDHHQRGDLFWKYHEIPTHDREWKIRNSAAASLHEAVVCSLQGLYEDVTGLFGNLFLMEQTTLIERWGVGRRIQ